jgi:hypothetical protein
VLQAPRDLMGGLPAAAAQVAGPIVNGLGRPDQASPVRGRLERQSMIGDQMLGDKPYVSHGNSVRP